MFLFGGKDSNNMIVPYAFHSDLADLASLFSSGELAVTANVGTLVKPLTRPQYQSPSAQDTAKFVLASGSGAGMADRWHVWRPAYRVGWPRG